MEGEKYAKMIEDNEEHVGLDMDRSCEQHYGMVGYMCHRCGHIIDPTGRQPGEIVGYPHPAGGRLLVVETYDE